MWGGWATGAWRTQGRTPRLAAITSQVIPTAHVHYHAITVVASGGVAALACGWRCQRRRRARVEIREGCVWQCVCLPLQTVSLRAAKGVVLPTAEQAACCSLHRLATGFPLTFATSTRTWTTCCVRCTPPTTTAGTTRPSLWHDTPAAVAAAAATAAAQHIHPCMWYEHTQCLKGVAVGTVTSRCLRSP